MGARGSLKPQFLTPKRKSGPCCHQMQDPRFVVTFFQLVFSRPIEQRCLTLSVSQGSRQLVLEKTPTDLTKQVSHRRQSLQCMFVTVTVFPSPELRLTDAFLCAVRVPQCTWNQLPVNAPGVPLVVTVGRALLWETSWALCPPAPDLWSCQRPSQEARRLAMRTRGLP